MKKRILSLLMICISLLCLAQNSPYHIIPAPKEISVSKGLFELNKQTVIISAEACMPEAKMFVTWLNKAAGATYQLFSMDKMPASNFILFTTSKEFNPNVPFVAPKLPGSLAYEIAEINYGQYKMVVDSRAIIVSAQFNTGVFYATQTLRQMMPPSSESVGFSLPIQLTGVRISDSPRFSHRGLLLDCARHFMTKDFILKYIDLLAYYKMNVFHWHLTEDQGWRLQIDRYPLLTEIGAWRIEADGTRYGGFYSKDDVKEIVAYATQHHVTIIPEIELPGHSTAAIAAYPELSCTGEKTEVVSEWGVFKEIYCAGNENTFTFLENVLSEVCELFPGQYIHIGGDEVPKFRWEHCDKCQKRITDEKLANEAELQTYFIERIAAFLATKGKRIIGWDEILEGGIPADAIVQSWRGMEGGENAAKARHSVIMSPTSHCYFDYGLDATDLREVYSFNPIPAKLSANDAGYIIGGECNMWTEHAPQNLVDSKVFPRMLALAEVLWTFPEQRKYDEFYKRVLTHQEMLASKVEFGFPTVPVSFNTRMEDGLFKIELLRNIEDLDITYLDSNKDSKIKNQFIPWTDLTLLLGEHANLDFKIKMSNHVYNEKPLLRNFDHHLGCGKTIQLLYEPSKWYSGGGMQALTDGCLGTSNFRDGIWQAVQGKNMEAVIDLGSDQKIQSIATNWFHYGNAWIFSPSEIEYFLSDDGISWKVLAVNKNAQDPKLLGELIIPLVASFEKCRTRYIKMIAHNFGPCPEWHDAPGEPTWLFCDEIVIR